MAADAAPASKRRWRRTPKDRVWHRKCVAVWRTVDRLAELLVARHPNTSHNKACTALDAYMKKEFKSLSKFKLHCSTFASAKVKVGSKFVPRKTVDLPAEIAALAAE